MQLKTRSFGVAVTALAATGLLAGVAFASSDASGTADNDDVARGAAIAKLAQTTTLTGEAKGDAVSAAAKTEATAEDADKDEAAKTEDTDKDEAAKTEDTDKDEHDSSDNDSHGDTVSALAKSTASGTGHGATVSATAKKQGDHK